MASANGRSSCLRQPLDEAEAVVENFFAKTGTLDEEFVTWQDMVRLAEDHGVSRVAKRPLSVAGLSVPIGLQRLILIKKGDAPVRQRFTLAHEIAHLFLDHETTKQVWLRTPVGEGKKAHDALESFCDDLAARILMPRSWLSQELKGKSPMPSLLLKLADKYGVSRQAFCIRAVGILDGAYHVAEWRKEADTRAPQHLRRSWQAAARGLNNLMPTTANTHSPVGELFEGCLARGTAVYSGEIVLAAKRETVEMRACLVQGSRPTILAVTRRAKPTTERTSIER